jgi:AraC-like DNA-binding protein
MLSDVDKGSVSISFVKQALRCVRRRRLAVAPLLEQADIAPALLARAQARVSAERFAQLWLSVASALDDEFFGLDSRRMKVGSFATLCTYSVHGRDLRAALRRAARFVELLLDDLQVRLVEQGAAARIVVRSRPGRPLAGAEHEAFAHETMLILLQGLMCWLVGRRIDILQACFAYSRPARWREYLVMYSPELAFERAESALAFDAGHLDAPVVQNEASAREFLRDAPYNIILKYKDASSWSARVRHQLRLAPPPDWPAFETLAERLQLGPASLRRRLDREGSSFRIIKDALRRDLAIDYLSHSDLSVEQIAPALGFAETSAFHRAFKQWTGARPGEYRRRLRTTSQPPARPPRWAKCATPSELPQRPENSSGTAYRPTNQRAGKGISRPLDGTSP